MKPRTLTSKIEPWWSLVGAPISQELIFRLAFYELYLKLGHFLEFTILSTATYALIHWYLGKKFVIYTFFLGLIFWFLMVYFGIIYAILAHGLHNYIYWYSGFIKVKKSKKDEHK